MNTMTDQDIKILERYARDENRELYWNYLASRPGSDGYGLLALGVVRNDNVSGAVANSFAEAEARRAGVRLSERDWNEFGVDLMQRDLRLRQEHFNGDRPHLALNLPARDVMQAHDEAFREARIPVNAWTPREYLQAARVQGAADAGANATPREREASADREMERGWAMMLDNRNWGLDRGAATLRNIADRYRDELPDAAGYAGRLTAARVLALESRPNTDPDRIGADSIYHERSRDGRWFLVNEAVSPLGMVPRIPREERDPARLRELEDTRQLRLEIRDRRDDFHPQDPARTEGIRRSPFTLADAGTVAPEVPMRVAASTMDQPSHPDHALYRTARSAVERMENGLGRDFDANSEALTRSCVVAARQCGMDRIDHALLSIDNGRDVRAGQNLFVVQGAGDDPAHLRACIRTDEALSRTPAECEQRLAEAREQTQAREHSEAQERQQVAAREGPSRSMG